MPVRGIASSIASAVASSVGRYNASGSAALPPLDIASGIVSAWWLAKMRTDYAGDCIKVRRSSDNAEQEIGFVGNDLDTASLLSFAGSGSAYVVTIYDQSGNGRNLTQSTASKQARIVNSGTLDTINSKPAMVFDGSDDFYVSSAVDLTSISNLVFYSALRQTDNTSTTRAIFETTAPNLAPGGWGAYQNNGASGVVGLGIGSGGAYLFQNTGSISAPRTMSLTGLLTPALGTQLTLRLDLTPQSISMVATSGTVTDSTFQNQAFYFGSRNGTGLFLSGSISGVVLHEASAVDSTIETYCGEWTGTGLTETLTPASVEYSSTQADGGGYIEGSAFSAITFSTAATTLSVESVNDIYGTYPNYTRIGVYVDGAYHSELNPGATGTKLNGVTLSAGTKTVSLVCGLQSKPSSTVIGTWIKSVSANAAMTRTNTVQTGGLVVYGDSILVGSDASPIMQNAWIVGVRLAASYPVQVEGWGFRSLYDDAANSTLRAALVTALTSNSPSIIWLAIGTNDYGLNKWSASSFETAYEALLSDLHTALPSATIYAQTPILRSTETANGSGSTLGNYRTAISNAASGKAYVTVVDGTAFLTTGDLSDGVHPNTTGHGLIESAVISELGI